jgi:hypothetical protein
MPDEPSDDEEEVKNSLETPLIDAKDKVEAQVDHLEVT